MGHGCFIEKIKLDCCYRFCVVASFIEILSRYPFYVSSIMSLVASYGGKDMREIRIDESELSMDVRSKIRS